MNTYRKVAGMVLMATRNQPAGRKKIELLLFLFELSHYVQYGRPISGATYKYFATPVPDELAITLHGLMRRRMLVKNEVKLPYGVTFEHRAEQQLDWDGIAGEYAQSELQVIEHTIQVLGPVCDRYLYRQVLATPWCRAAMPFERVDFAQAKADETLVAWLKTSGLLLDPALLVYRYPRLLRRRIHSAFRSRGFECGKGWFLILDTLFRRIEMRCAQMGLPDERYPAVIRAGERQGVLAVELRLAACSVPSSAQISDLVEEASEASSITCELCSRSAKLRTDGRRRVRCDCCEGRGEEE